MAADKASNKLTDHCQQTEHNKRQGEMIPRNEHRFGAVGVCVSHWTEMKVMGRKVRLV